MLFTISSLQTGPIIQFGPDKVHLVSLVVAPVVVKTTGSETCVRLNSRSVHGKDIEKKNCMYIVYHLLVYR